MALKIAGNDSFKMKNIADLQQLDTLPSSANVIVEHGGFAKRFDASKLEGKVRSVNGIEPDENGNVQIEVGAGDGSGIAVQSDWNQNDETAADYVKNRTHYSNGFVEKTFLPETTTVTCCHTDLPAVDIIPDNTYIVTWDGVDYECVAYADENGDVIGNQLLAGTSLVDSGEPFFIGEWQEFAEDDSIVYMCAIGFTENKVHTIKVSEKIVDGDNVVIEEILPETELVDYDSILYDSHGYSISIEIGATYTVVWDGNEYECVAKGDEDMDIRYLGNYSLFPLLDEEQGVEDTGEPFLVLRDFNEKDNNYMDIFHKIAGAHTIEIKGLVENVKVIDPKYLPKGGFGYEERVVQTIVNTTVDISIDNDLYALLAENVSFITGETYAVSLNDDKYECVAWELNGIVAIGNGGLVNEEMSDLGEDVPFICPNFDGFCEIVVESEGTYSVKIDGATSKTHVIDHEYLGIRPLEIRCLEWRKDGSPYTDSCVYDGSRNSDGYIYIDPLPSVGSSDNGMLLGVVNGGWGVVEPPSSGGSGGSDGVSSWNDLTDRPFSSETVTQLSEQTLTFVDQGEGMSMAALPNSVSLDTDGQACLVIFDGTQYVCTTALIDGQIVCGNTNIPNWDDIPFTILVLQNQPIMIVENAGQHTVSIFVEKITKIPAKYIPETRPYFTYIEGGYSRIKSYDDLPAYTLAVYVYELRNPMALFGKNNLPKYDFGFDFDDIFTIYQVGTKYVVYLRQYPSEDGIMRAQYYVFVADDEGLANFEREHVNS